MSVNRSGAALVIAGHLGLAWLVVLQTGPQADAHAPTALLVRLHAAVSTQAVAAARSPAEPPMQPERQRVPTRITPAAPVANLGAELASGAPAVAAVEPAAQQSPEPAPTLGPAREAVAIPESLLIARPDHAFSPPPAHPPVLLERGIGGVVWLRVLVERDGHAAEVQLLRGSGQRLLDESALDAVRRWRFVAARRGMQSLASWVEFPIRFTVRDPDQRATL